MLDRSSAHPTDPVTLPGISRTLDCEGKSKLFEHGAQRQWARHQMLFAAGKPIKSLHRVASGVLARSIALPKGRRQIVDFLFTGDICNLVQSDGTHMFDCEAITDATTCAVDASVLRKFTGASVAIGKALEEKCCGLLTARLNNW